MSTKCQHHYFPQLYLLEGQVNLPKQALAGQFLSHQPMCWICKQHQENAPKQRIFWNWTKVNHFTPSALSIWFMSFHFKLGYNPTWHWKSHGLWVLCYCQGSECPVGESSTARGAHGALQVLHSFPLSLSDFTPLPEPRRWAALCHLHHPLLPAPDFWARTLKPSPTSSPWLPLHSQAQKFSGILYLDKQVIECPWSTVLGSSPRSEHQLTAAWAFTQTRAITHE